MDFMKNYSSKQIQRDINSSKKLINCMKLTSTLLTAGGSGYEIDEFIIEGRNTSQDGHMSKSNRGIFSKIYVLVQQK